MINFLTNHVLEILAILVPLGIALWPRRKKAFSYSIKMSKPVVYVSDEPGERVIISYGGRKVSRVDLIEIKFRNNGGLPVLPEEFREPLSLSFERPSYILDSAILDKERLGVKVRRPTSKNRVVFEDRLYNPGDAFEVRLYVADGGTKFTIRGRIDGIRSFSVDPSALIEKFFNAFAYFWLLYGGFLLVYLVLAIVVAVFLPGRYVPYLAYIAALWLGLGLVHGIIVRYYETRRRLLRDSSIETHNLRPSEE